MQMKVILFGIAKNRRKFCTKIYTPRLLAYARKSVDILVRFAGEECKHGYLRIYERAQEISIWIEEFMKFRSSVRSMS